MRCKYCNLERVLKKKDLVQTKNKDIYAKVAIGHLLRMQNVIIIYTTTKS